MSMTEETAETSNIESQKKGILKRRARSSSTHENNKHRIRLVDQHYKIDKQSHSLLPGAKTHDKDLARDIHDFFNLITLVRETQILSISFYDPDVSSPVFIT